jgi:3-deoxy-D-manno-octulosonic-acid transferase
MLMPRLPRSVASGPRLLFGAFYTLLWCVAGPLLFFSSRMRQGWRQRLGLGRIAPCEIWMQGASAGECALVASLLPHLQDTPVLVTTCTSQGLDVLTRTAVSGLQTRMLPLDLPWLMGRVLDQARPRLVVLLETEIWPGLLMACARRGVPVVVVNGRMTPSSLAGYLFLRPVLGPLAPSGIGAISPDDARRFALVFGPERVGVSGNIKFDRALDAAFLPRKDNPLAWLVPEDRPFLVLGSVREQEEPHVLELIRLLRAGNADCVIGLFPRHMHRLEAWASLLTGAGLAWIRRSQLTGPAEPGTIVLWDQFGELNQAYALARRAFVGGSLARLGGQNFLEPLAQGVLPCVGPHTRNFDWAGETLFEKLVLKSADLPLLASTLLSPAPPREEVRRQALDYVGARQGASARSMNLIRHHLTRSHHA